MKFTPIKPKKVSTQIAEQIRASILAGEFNPGDKLPPERELADLFGVSRPSVREALNYLASSGLVETYQGGGTVVRSLVENHAGLPLSELIRIDGDRALDVIEVRKGMESWTVWYAA
jgi:GntR family transcriptional regulator, transcriptional repressor for pyruvate dehydrogenase complex